MAGYLACDGRVGTPGVRAPARRHRLLPWSKIAPRSPSLDRDDTQDRPYHIAVRQLGRMGRMGQIIFGGSHGTLCVPWARRQLSVVSSQLSVVGSRPVLPVLTDS